MQIPKYLTPYLSSELDRGGDPAGKYRGFPRIWYVIIIYLSAIVVIIVVDKR
jgi:hypothetical protein